MIMPEERYIYCNFYVVPLKYGFTMKWSIGNVSNIKVPSFCWKNIFEKYYYAI